MIEAKQTGEAVFLCMFITALSNIAASADADCDEFRHHWYIPYPVLGPRHSLLICCISVLLR